MIVIIVISSIKLIADTHWDADPKNYTSTGDKNIIFVLDTLDFIFDSIFIFELCTKVIA